MSAKNKTQLREQGEGGKEKAARKEEHYLLAVAEN
jgi:hypothetical protein